MRVFAGGVLNSQEITHENNLVNSEEPTHFFVETMRLLGDRLGPLLVQLPPSFAVEGMGVLEDFLSILPEGPHHAVEVRHRSWLGDRREFPEGHIRPRRDRTEDLAWWAERIDAFLSEGREVLAYANNHSPSILEQFLEILREKR